MELNKETRDRIFAAADELFEQGDRESFPTVDAVRKAARVNMNDASAGMREWRRQRTAQTAPLAVQVPDAVQQAGNQAVAALWQAAQALANESLQAAQAGWDRERNELEAVRRELADAYEAQARELEEAQARVTLLEQQAAEATELVARQATDLAEARDALAGVEQRAALATQRADEVERRAQELRAELDYAHQDARAFREESRKALDAANQEAQALRSECDTTRREAEELRTELAAMKAKAQAEAEAHQEQKRLAAQEAARQAERFTKVQAERDEARQEARTAQEEAAMLRGRLGAERVGGNTNRGKSN
ncbi:DNA-binding protein [Escherichia coli]|nr:DNA-binding protein [Escherichia coli]